MHFVKRNITRLLAGVIAVVTIMLSVSASAATISGQRKKWQPITLDFNGPFLEESGTSPNPFLDYRLTVTMTAPNGQTSVLPGFFAGNGQGGAAGQIWRARFSPDQEGRWSYSGQLRTGSEVAISLDNNAGNAVNLDGATGQFDVSGIASDARGFTRLGRLEYVGNHYMKFRDGPYWICLLYTSPSPRDRG